MESKSITLKQIRNANGKIEFNLVLLVDPILAPKGKYSGFGISLLLKEN